MNIDIHINEHCNLNCAYCSHCSSIAEEEYMNIEQFEKDAKRLVELNVPIEHLVLLGGEPLLHPRCDEFCQYAYDIFPSSVKRILSTNGLLLNQMSDDFWQCIRDTRTVIRLSLYPLPNKYDNIDLLESKRVEYFVTGKGLFHGSPLTLNSLQDPSKSFNQCGFKMCPTVHNGKFYKCFVSAQYRHVQKYFELDIPIPTGFDIHTHNLTELYEYINNPTEFCKHCKFDQWLPRYDWALSKFSLSEFVSS